MKKILLLVFFVFLSLSFPFAVKAQTTTPVASPSSVPKETNNIITAGQTKIGKQTVNEFTNPGQDSQKEIVLRALSNIRHTKKISFFNAVPFAIQYAIVAGVPTDTIVLILLLPVLATIVVAFRYIVGLSGIGLLVPIALSITFLATDVTPGFIMLAAIIVASLISRFILKRLPLMQMPKVALSMFMVAIFLLFSLTISSIYGVIDVHNLSIFPILLFILLSDRIVTIFLERDFIDTIQTTIITLFLAILGYLLLTWGQLRFFIILYPETILLLIPINILIGRYFGLRMIEYLKFQPIFKHAGK